MLAQGCLMGDPIISVLPIEVVCPKLYADTRSRAHDRAHCRRGNGHETRDLVPSAHYHRAQYDGALRSLAVNET